MTLIRPHGPPPWPPLMPSRIALDALLEVTPMRSTSKLPVHNVQKDGTKTKRTNNFVFRALPAKYKSQKVMSFVQAVNQEEVVDQKMQPM